MLEVQIVIDSTTYYVSDEGHAGSDGEYYFPFLARRPRVRIGATRGGWITTQSGQIDLVNDPYNSNHPFGGQRYRDLLSNAGTDTSLPKIAIKDPESGIRTPLFEGAFQLNKITEDVLSFGMQGLTSKQIAGSDKFVGDETATDSSGAVVNIPYPIGQLYNAADATVYKGSQKWAIGASGKAGFNTYNLAADDYPYIISNGTALYSSGTPTISESEIDGGVLTPAFSNGQTLISGIGNKLGTSITAEDSRCDSLLDFVHSCARYIGFSEARVETTKASEASSIILGYVQRGTVDILELLSQITEANNYQFYIADNPDTASAFYNAPMIYLIDRANNPAATTLSPSNIISSSYLVRAPFQQVNTTLTFNVFQGTQLETKTRTVTSENLSYGTIKTFEFYWGTLPLTFDAASTPIQTAQARMDAIKNIEKKPIASVTVDGIQGTYTPGDRFTFNRVEDQIKVDMLTRDISFDWGSNTTTLSGDATLSIFEDS